MKITALVLFLALAGSSTLLLATHHSFAAYFDTQQPFSVKGTVVKVDWVNPVIFIHLRVEDGTNGNSTTWAFEGESVNSMERRSITRGLFNEGDVITVIGWKAKAGTNLSETVMDPELAARVRAESAASAAQFELADGQKFPMVNNVPEPRGQER